MPRAKLSDRQVRLLRLRAQHLAEQARRKDLLGVVRDVVGIQAQMPQAAALSLRARVAGLTRDDVRGALEARRTLIRTWVMRGTLHLVASADLPWMLAALPDSVLREVPRWLERRAGLVMGSKEAATEARKVERLLRRRGPLTRNEIVEAVGLGPEAGYGLMRLAALHGWICYGPDRGADHTFVSVREWLPDLPAPAPPPPGELARRYLAGYGPAEPSDLATWWGLPLGAARKEWEAMGGYAVEVAHRGRTLTAPRKGLRSLDEPASLPVRLVGAWDAYLLGHRDRSLILDPRHARKVNRGGGWVHQVVLVDGRITAVWRAKRRAARLRIEVQPFGRLPPGVRDAIDGEAEDVGRFLGAPVELAFSR
jgi:hypothetical protein